MTDKKISELTLRSPDGTEEIPVNASGVNYKITTLGLSGLSTHPVPFEDNGVANAPFYGPPIGPNAVYYSDLNETWIAWQSYNRTSSLQTQSIRTFDHTTRHWTPVVEVGTNTILFKDDHGQPAIVRDGDGYVHLFGNAHLTALYHFVTDSPNDPSSWSAGTNINAVVTYPHPFYIGGALYVFVRGSGSGTLSDLALYKSATLVSGAVTWNSAVNILDFGALYRVDPGQFEVSGTNIYITVCKPDFNDTARQNAYVLIYHTTDGSVSNLSGSHTVAAGSLPISTSDMDTYFLAQRVYNTDDTVPVLCFDTTGVLHLSWNENFTSGSTGYDQLYHSRWDGTTWTPTDLVATGTITAGSNMFPRTDGTVRFITGHQIGVSTTTLTAGGTASTATFDSTHVNDNTVLSNGNLTVAKSGGSTQTDGTTSNVGVSSGKYYCEFTIDNGSASEVVGFGVGNLSGAVLDQTGATNFLGVNSDGVGYYPALGKVYLNSAVVTTIAAAVNTDKVCMALDATNKRLWFRTNGGNWNNSAPANPVTNVGGIDISAIYPSFFVWATVLTSGRQVTINFGATAYSFTPPTGFGNWLTDTGVFSDSEYLQSSPSSSTAVSYGVATVARVFSGLPELEFIWGEAVPFTNTGAARAWAWGESGFIEGDLSGNYPPVDAGRIALTANTTFYFRSDGSDTNGTGLVDILQGAFATPQALYNHLVQYYDFAGFTATMQAGAETGSKSFAGVQLLQGWTGNGGLIIAGNTTGGTTTFTANAYGPTVGVSGTLPGVVEVRRATLTSAANDCIQNVGSGLIQLGPGLTFSTAGAAHMHAQGIDAGIDCGVTYTISGNATIHVDSRYGAIIADSIGGSACTVTLTGTPAFSTAFASATGGAIKLSQTTYSGAGTGLRWILSENGLIETTGSNATFFPTTGSFSKLSGTYKDTTGSISWLGDASAGFSATGRSFAVNTNLDTIIWNGGKLGWSTTTTADVTNVFGSGWVLDAASLIGQRNSTTAQSYRVYNTFTDTSNYERAVVDWNKTANVLSIGTEKAGTGQSRGTQLLYGGTPVIDYGSAVYGQFLAIYNTSTISTGLWIDNTSTGGHQFLMFSTGQANFPGHFGYYNGTIDRTILDLDGLTNVGFVGVYNTGGFAWSASTNAVAAKDTFFYRSAAGVVGVGATSTTATGQLISGLVSTNQTLSAAQTIPAGFSSYVPELFTIAAGIDLELGAGAILEIGG